MTGEREQLAALPPAESTRPWAVRAWVARHESHLAEVRLWLVAVIVGMSVANPGLFNRYGFLLALVVAPLPGWGSSRADMVVVATTAFVVWQTVSLTWAVNPEALNFVVTAAKTALMFLILRVAVSTRRQLRVVAGTFVAAAVLGVLRLFVDGYNYSAFSTIRYTIEGINANYLGYSLTAALGAAVLVWGTTTARKVRGLLIAAAVVVLVGAWLTGTRGAALGAAALAFWLVGSRILSRPPFRTLLVMAFLAAVAITSGVFDSALRAFDVGGRSTGDLSGRLVLWPAARELWTSSPLVGHGPKAMRYLGPLDMDAHSVFLEILSALGVVGLALFCWLVWATLFRGTASLGSSRRALLLGTFVCSTGPAYLTGSWEASPGAWMVLFLFSSIGILETESETESQVHTVRAKRPRIGTTGRSSFLVSRPQQHGRPAEHRVMPAEMDAAMHEWSLARREALGEGRGAFPPNG